MAYPDPRCKYADCGVPEEVEVCSRYIRKGAICADGWFGNRTSTGTFKTKKEIKVSSQNTLNLRDLFT